MTREELTREFDKRWRKERPVQYGIWLICEFGAFVPLIFGFIQVFSGITRKSVVRIMICLAVFFVLELTATLLMRHHRKGLPDYLERNRNRINE